MNGFPELLESLRNGDFESFKAISVIYPTIIDQWFETIVFNCPDDLKWIEWCATRTIRIFTQSTLDLAISKGKRNISYYLLRRLECISSIKLYVFGVDPSIVRVAIDCGITKTTDVNYYEEYPSAICARQQLRQNAICILGAKRCYSQRIACSAGFADVLQIIARCMWSARLTEEFWF
jgi:hypothetical protein